MSRIQLFNAQTSNGDSEFFSPSAINPFQKQDPILGISGVWDGAEIDIYWRDAEGNWDKTGDTTITEDFRSPIAIDSSATAYKLVLSNAGASTSLSAWGDFCQTIS